jgi:CheY-like chemotaxis protein
VPSPAAGTDRAATASAGPVRVLIVDDHDEARYALRGTLARAGSFLVTEAARGEEALSWARAEHPDLIFLDLGLPDMTGFQVLDRLKADETCRDIPVVIHTSRTLGEEELRALRGRAASILDKSFFSREDAAARLLDSLEKLDLGRHKRPGAES